MAGKLEPITITAYTNKELTELAQAPNKFVFPINPEQYTQQYKIGLDQSRPTGSSAPAPGFKSTDPEQLMLEFLFDSTGVLDEYYKNSEVKGKPVREQIEKFMKVAYVVNEQTHKPNFLKILWGSNNFTYQRNGDAAFDCYLSQLDIQYTLFNRSGEPIRAKVRASFTRYVEPRREAAQANRSSPDLTHVRTAREGDTLPLLTYNLIGDQNFYLKVARANNLTTFRPLQAGSELFFPPIEKPT